MRALSRCSCPTVPTELATVLHLDRAADRAVLYALCRRCSGARQRAALGTVTDAARLRPMYAVLDISG